MNETPQNPLRIQRVPLLGRILGWLLLNLLLLGAVFYLVFQTQFRFELDALMAGPVGDRVQAVTQALAGALRSSPPEEWNDVLKSFGSAYKADFSLLDSGGAIVAGTPEELPEAVMARAEERRGPGEAYGRGPPIGKGPRRPWGEIAPPFPIQPRFTLRTESPRRYWIGMRIPPMTPPEGEFARPMPWTILLSTNSLYSGGLFLDMKVWMWAGGGALLLSVLLWIPLVRGLTRSISLLTQATDEIAHGNFDVRVQDGRGDELGQLGHSINQMADRLNGFVKGQKRFLGDTAHELCSPLARMQVALGILGESASGIQQNSVNDLREELEEMSSLINELLSFSKAGLAEKDSPLESVDLAGLTAEAATRENVSGRAIELEVRPETRVLARSDLLRRALANVIRNALRYAGAYGPVRIYDQDEDEHVLLAVRDLGPGVNESELQKIFDPFYRTEQSRSRETGGAGLGLAIVKTCVEACGGAVRAANLRPQGFEVVLRLRKSALTTKSDPDVLRPAGEV